MGCCLDFQIVILKNLKENGEASNGKYPSLAQLGRKKRLIIKTSKKFSLISLDDLRDMCENNKIFP